MQKPFRTCPDWMNLLKLPILCETKDPAERPGLYHIQKNAVFLL